MHDTNIHDRNNAFGNSDFGSNNRALLRIKILKNGAKNPGNDESGSPRANRPPPFDR